MAKPMKPWARSILCGDGEIRRLMPPKTIDELKRTLLIRSRLENRGHITPCRVWIGCKDSCGYGVQRFQGKARKVQRLAWMVKTGSFPKDLEVCHKCDQPDCFEESHLFTGTHLENMTDAKHKKRMGSKTFGVKHYCASFTENQIIELRKQFDQGLLVTRKLARKYSVTPEALKKIRDFRSWKHIK